MFDGPENEENTLAKVLPVLVCRPSRRLTSPPKTDHFTSHRSPDPPRDYFHSWAGSKTPCAKMQLPNIIVSALAAIGTVSATSSKFVPRNLADSPSSQFEARSGEGNHFGESSHHGESSHPVESNHLVESNHRGEGQEAPAWRGTGVQMGTAWSYTSGFSNRFFAKRKKIASEKEAAEQLFAKHRKMTSEKKDVEKAQSNGKHSDQHSGVSRQSGSIRSPVRGSGIESGQRAQGTSESEKEP